MKEQKYLTLIRLENDDWKIGFHITSNLDEHLKFEDETIRCDNVKEVKVLKVEEV